MYEQVSATLEAAIEDLEIPADSAALKQSFALLDRFTAKVTTAVGAFDAPRSGATPAPPR